MIFGRVFIRKILRLGGGQGKTNGGRGLIPGKEGVVEMARESTTRRRTRIGEPLPRGDTLGAHRRIRQAAAWLPKHRATTAKGRGQTQRGASQKSGERPPRRPR